MWLERLQTLCQNSNIILLEASLEDGVPRFIQSFAHPSPLVWLRLTAEDADDPASLSLRLREALTHTFSQAFVNAMFPFEASVGILGKLQGGSGFLYPCG